MAGVRQRRNSKTTRGFCATHAEISRSAGAIRMVQRDVTAMTANLADYERVRRVALLAEEFTIDSGELTPTLKVKRGVIDQKYGKLIDELYRST